MFIKPSGCLHRENQTTWSFCSAKFKIFSPVAVSHFISYRKVNRRTPDGTINQIRPQKLTHLKQKGLSTPLWRIRAVYFDMKNT